MKRSELQYDLPPERIAQHPVEPRDAARLLVVHRPDGRLEHRRFRDLLDYLHSGDALVLNDTRVVPARFFAQRASGGRIEGLFLRQAEGEGEWLALLKPTARLRAGEQLRLEPATAPAGHSTEIPGDGTQIPSADSQGCPVSLGASPSGSRSTAPLTPALELIALESRGIWRCRPRPPTPALALLNHIGHTPLPPYIRGGIAAAADACRYQTVYADSPGAVAAPTAGLHFTSDLLERIAAAGVRQARVTLHVGLGTFAPIDADDLAEHRMHAEWFEAPEGTPASLSAARAAGGRIVAVGTTSVRVLESLPAELGTATTGGTASVTANSARGWTDIFIYPPYRFRNVDMLITNFHLPESTLLALVTAFAGVELTRRAYDAAIAEGYRFYSYGDAMLVL